MFFALFLVSFESFGQKIVQIDSAASPVKDTTMREFEIIRGPSMRVIDTDTGTIQSIAGGAVVKQAGTKFSADSIVLNNDSHILQSYGNVHINDGDTVHIYSKYLSYDANRKYAFLKNSVKLTGRNGTLFTEELDYNLNTSIANYYKGGRIINEKNIITSKRGTYYADTRDVYFKDNVKMDGPKDHVRSDSLIYNMNDGGITFVSSTYIKNDDVEIRTSEGRYDSNTGDAFFSSRTNIKDSSGRIYTSNTMALEGETGKAQLEGNAIIIDSANGFSLLANQIFLDDKNNSFLATRKPLLMVKQKNDSTWIAADTIFSGLGYMLKKPTAVTGDSAEVLNKQQTEKIINVQADTPGTSALPGDFLNIPGGLRPPPPKVSDSLHQDINLISDSIQISVNDTSALHADGIKVDVRDSSEMTHDTDIGKTKTDSLLQKGINSTVVQDIRLDTLQPIIKSDTLVDSTGLKDSVINETEPLQKDSLQTTQLSDSTTISPDSARFFIAFHNVRIFNDSLQSVCDSLFISSVDSVFRLYQNPVVWNGSTQVSGDTMYLFTKNKEAERLYVFDRAVVANQTEEGFFNQMAGKTMNAFFKNNEFDSIRFRGSQAESIYYLREDDGSYFGVNRASGDVIEMLFKNGELDKVVFINQVPGMMYPMGQVPEDKQKLKDFEWLDNRRPKNKAELFQ